LCPTFPRIIFPLANGQLPLTFAYYFQLGVTTSPQRPFFSVYLVFFLARYGLTPFLLGYRTTKCFSSPLPYWLYFSECFPFSFYFPFLFCPFGSLSLSLMPLPRERMYGHLLDFLSQCDCFFTGYLSIFIPCPFSPSPLSLSPPLSWVVSSLFLPWPFSRYWSTLLGTFSAGNPSRFSISFLHS